MINQLVENWQDKIEDRVKFDYIELCDGRHITIRGSVGRSPYCKIHDFHSNAEARDYLLKFVEGAKAAGYLVKELDKNTFIFTR